MTSYEGIIFQSLWILYDATGARAEVAPPRLHARSDRRHGCSPSFAFSIRPSRAWPVSPSRPLGRYQIPGIMAHLFLGYSGNRRRYHAWFSLAASARFAATATTIVDAPLTRGPDAIASPTYSTTSAA